MAQDWLSSIKNISGLISGLSSIIKNNRATKDLLLRELKLNIKAFEIAQKRIDIDYDKLLGLLKNERIKKSRENRFVFSSIKKGRIKKRDINDSRNKRYIGKDCEWLFKNIDEKIEDLRNQKTYYDSLDAVENSNIALQFSNLFFKLKLLAEFIYR